MNSILKTYAIGVGAGTIMVSAALCVLPGAPAAFVVSAFLVILLLMAAIGRQCCWMTSSVAGTIIAALTISTIGVIANTWYFTEGGLLSEPYLQNNDMRIDWSNAMCYLNGLPLPPDSTWRNYSWIIVATCAVFGQNIAVPMMLNVLLYGLTLLTIGQVAFYATDDRRIAKYSVIIGACICYLLAQSMTLLKDVPCTLLMGLIALLFLRMSRHAEWSKWQYAVAMLLLILATTILRTPSAPLVAIGALLFIFTSHSKATTISYVAIAIVAIAAFLWLPVETLNRNIVDAINTPADSQMIFNDSNTRAWDVMMDNGEDAENLTIWRRLLWLPASVVVQFLVPFPWHFLYHANYGPSMILSHMAYPWYITGALIIYWLALASRKSPRQLQVLVAWGIVLTVLIALGTTGRISRYCLPLLPMLLPAAGMVVSRYLRYRSLWIWMGVFGILLAITLLICHYLQGQFM